MTTYETNVNNNNVYEEEVDNSSETSKDNYSSSASSFIIDETKKVTVEDKEERNLSSSKRKKRHSFISMFNPKKDGKDGKDEKENGLVRSLSGIFNKDKDNNKRNVENQRRSTSRTSSNSDKNGNGHGFVFYSDDDEKPENDTTPKKGRQSSNAETLEKEKSKKRISVHIGKFFESKPSPKPKNMNMFEDSFLEPGETTIKSPSSPSKKHDKKYNNKNDNNNDNSNSNNDINNINNNIESYQIHDSIISNTFPPKNTDDSSVDIQSTTSFTHDDQEISSNDNDHIYNNPEYEYNPSSPTTPKTPRLIVTPTDPESSPLEFTDQNNTGNSIIGPSPYEIKERIFTPLTISTNITKPIPDTIEQQHGYNINKNTETSQDLEEINKSLNNVKGQLEAKVAEQDVQLTKFNSMEHIMQQQMDLSRRMTETMQRLESKVNVQKDEVDGTSISKVFEETIRRLESKIDSQNEEILKLKSVVGQLSGGSQQLLLTNGEFSRLRITQGEDQNLMLTQGALIQANQPQSQTYSGSTLVSTLVVNPLYNTITVSASIATSVLYAVYVRPVVGLVSVFREGISTNCETKN